MQYQLICNTGMHLALSPPPPPPPRQRIIILAFLFPNSQDNPPLNMLVAKVSKYATCHVELVFEDDMSFSIFAGSKLFFKHRTFSNPEYKLLSVAVSHAEYNSLYNFCQSASKHELGFTDVGMYMCYLQPRHCPVFNTPPSVEVGYTFCSKIVTEALQFAGASEAEHLIPCTTSPSCLYGAFKDSPRLVLSSVGYKREQLRQVGVIGI
jgi:hypothetical protein